MFCLVFLISEKSDYLRRVLLVSEFNFKDTTVHYRYGDLYRQCLIEDFKESIYWPNRKAEENVPDDADIFLIGDSYFERPIAGDYIADELEKQCGFNIYDITAFNSDAVNNPLDALKELRYNKSRSRILVLETTERFSLSRGLVEYIPIKNSVNFDNNVITNWIYRIFVNRLFYVEHNYLTLPILSFKNTFDFKVFKTVDRNIGAFSTSPPLLFYSQDVEFADRKKTPETIDSMVNNIVMLNKALKNYYNMTLLYIIIPDKFSIYNDYVNGEYHYSGFIPALKSKLDDNKIYTVDLYTKFLEYKMKSPDKVLYIKSDSHFNKFGKEIFLEVVCSKLKEIRNNSGN